MTLLLKTKRLLTFALCTIVCQVPLVEARSATNAFWQRDWEEIHWEGVVRQTTPRNCGPSTVANALLMFGEAALPGELYPEVESTSLAILRDILASRGYTGIGLRMTLAGLQSYLLERRTPAIAHILVPNPHFTLVTGAAAGRILTRDPALGTVSWEAADWEQVWSGAALLVTGGDDTYPEHPINTDEEHLLSILQLLMRPRAGMNRRERL
jgi:predicted double-glycine peptidase